MFSATGWQASVFILVYADWENTIGCRSGTLGKYWGADKSLGRPTSRCILFDGENISFDASLVIYT
jgi:hypothetical protein